MKTTKIVTVIMVIIFLICSLCACSKNSLYNKSDTIDDNSAIGNKDHNEISTEDYENDTVNDEDEILAEGDDYILVRDISESYTGTTEKIGVKNKNGDWIVEMSEQNYLTQLPSSQADFQGSTIYAQYAYLGDGIFVGSYGVDLFLQDGRVQDIGNNVSVGPRKPLDVYFYNAKSNSGFMLNVFYITEVINGYFLASDDENIYKCDTQDNHYSILLENASLGGPLSEDVFFVNGGYFFDINGKLIIDISKYDPYNHYNGDYDFQRVHFSNGKCYFEFDNPNKIKYHVEINKNGEFLYEPET